MVWTVLGIPALILGALGFVWFFNVWSIRQYFKRVATAIRAFYSLYTMPQDMIDSFLESYTLFEEEAVTPENTHKIQNYYVVLNHLCAMGEVEKMYIPPLMDDSGGIIRNQNLIEEKMMRDLELRPGLKVLDVGCGRGRIAAHVANYSGASVTGINIEASQVANAIENAKDLGLTDRLKFKIGDFNSHPLDFQDDSFDGLYEVQALSYIRGGNFDPLFKEMFRVLKPGAKVCFLEWVSLPKYDPKKKEHRELLRQVKPLLGAVFTPSVEDITSALERAGFKIKLLEIPSIDGFQYPLVQRAANYFLFMSALVNALTFLRILPSYFKVLMDRFNKDGDVLIEGDRMRLWTTTYEFVAEKPKN